MRHRSGRIVEWIGARPNGGARGGDGVDVDMDEQADRPPMPVSRARRLRASRAINAYAAPGIVTAEPPGIAAVADAWSD